RPLAVSKCPVRHPAADAAGVVECRGGTGAGGLLRREEHGLGRRAGVALGGGAGFPACRRLLLAGGAECCPRLCQSRSRQARAPGAETARGVAGYSGARPARTELANHPGPSLASHRGLGGARGGEKLQSGPCVVPAAGGNAAALSRTVGVVVLLYRSWGASDRAGPERAAAQLGPARPRPGTSP